MTDEVKTTPEVEAKTPEVETTTEPTAPVQEQVAEKTIGEMVEETIPEKKPNMIPESVFLGEKKARKEAERQVRELKQQIEGGATTEQISDSIAEIAEEHDIDKKFLNKLATAIKTETEKDLDAKYSSQLADKGKEKFETVFNKAYDSAMDRAPEFKAIANPEVIKNLASLPQNANKNLTQILEETYGNAVPGKRTIETTTPGGGKEPEPLDVARAGRDTEYFKEVMSNPKLKAQYNDQMLKKGF